MSKPLKAEQVEALLAVRRRFRGATSFDMFGDVRGQGFKVAALARRGLIQQVGYTPGGYTLWELTPAGWAALDQLGV